MRTLLFAFLSLGLLATAASGAATPAGPLDRQIQIRVMLPPATPPDDQIYIAGDFQDPSWDPAGTPLQRDGLVATGTITVPAQTLTVVYKFTRNASWDFVEKNADCSETDNRTTLALPDAVISATVATWRDLCGGSGPAIDPRAQPIEIFSTALGITKTVYVYQSAAYSAPGAMPALYLLRGHETEWVNRFQDSSRAGTTVIDVYEDLLASGQLGPMLLVFPGISSSDNSVPGMATNFVSPTLTSADGIGSGRFEDYMVQDVLPAIETRFHTLPSRSARGVDGFSLGGFMSTKLAAQHPELFSTAGAFDGLYFYATPDCASIDTLRDTTFANSLFDPAFGRPRNLPHAAANNAPNLICRSDATTIRSITWMIQYGALTSEPTDANHLRGEHLMQHLEAKGVTNAVSPTVLEGGHRWSVADEHMRQTLPLHWQALQIQHVFAPLIGSF